MILLPRKKIIAPRRFQRGNIVYHTEADPLYSEVTWLSDFENQSGEAFTPQVGAAQSWWSSGGSQPGDYDGEITTAQAKFGTRSLYFKDSGGAPSAGWAADAKVAGTVYGFTGDFTVECHIYILNRASSIDIFGLWDFGERQWQLTTEAGNARVDFTISMSGSNNNSVISQHAWGGPFTDGIPTDDWFHLAICRSGTSWYAWLDGVQSDNGTQVDSNVIHVPTDAYFVIGQEGFEDGSGSVEAYLDNIRITDGTARYTAPFTPPTEAFPNF